MASSKTKSSRTPATKKSAARKVASKKGAPKIDARVLDYLAEEAKAAQEKAYAPYSKYKVGAAVLTKSGRVYRGANFENASYGACICAERGAVGTMVAAGDREPIACVVVTNGKEPASPCGICRQVFAEFAEDMTILLVGRSARGETRVTTTLAELLPRAFRGSALPK